MLAENTVHMKPQLHQLAYRFKIAQSYDYQLKLRTHLELSIGIHIHDLSKWSGVCLCYKREDPKRKWSKKQKFQTASLLTPKPRNMNSFILVIFIF